MSNCASMYFLKEKKILCTLVFGKSIGLNNFQCFQVNIKVTLVMVETLMKIVLEGNSNSFHPSTNPSVYCLFSQKIELFIYLSNNLLSLVFNVINLNDHLIVSLIHRCTDTRAACGSEQDRSGNL